MMVLLVLKENLKSLYGRFAVVADALIKFCLSFVCMLMLNANIGFMAELNSTLAAAFLALICAFLPYGAITFVLAMVMLGHIYAVSFEIALITGIFLILVALLYYGFQPGDSYWLLLTPLAFALRIPFAVPLIAGLSGSLLGVIPICCGTVIYYIMNYVKQNAGVLTNDASVDITQKYVQLLRAMISNRTMLIFLAVCAVGVLITYLVRTLSVDYAWILAIILGMVGQLTVIFAGDFMYSITVSVPEILVGCLVSLAIAGVYHFFVFAVDYSRTEYTQFEDDDYVYYVKAVPKMAVSRPDVRVQRINNPKPARRGGRQEQQ